MDKKLNIALFTDNFLPGVGGTEVAVYNLAKSLVELGHNVLVIAPHYNKKKENDNFPFKVFRKNSLRIDSNNYFAMPNFNKKLKQALLEFRPDIIHCHTQASFLTLALKSAKYFNIPCVSTIHTKFSCCYKNAVHANFIVKPMLKMIGKKLKKASVVTSVSFGMGEEFKLYGYNGEFRTIKNGATFKKSDDENLMTYAKNIYNFNENDNILLFVGHISQIKNLEFIFKSLDALYELNNNFKMVFVGSGDGDNYFRKLASEKKYKDNILFTGQITDKKVLQSIYANSKLFIFPSTFDTDGLTVVEAAIYQTPSIVIEKTGASERITNNQNGFTIPNEPQKMAEKIDYLLKNPKIISEVGKNASEQLPKTWMQATKEYLDIYYDVLNKNND